MLRMSHALAPIALVVSLALASGANAEKIQDPLRFFEGATESVSTVKIMLKKPYRTRAVGKGRINPDGALDLVQRIEGEGKAPKVRRWIIRQTAPGHYAGTMNEAVGPVSIDEVGGRYRFRFRMKGNLAVEQWLTPEAGGRAARNELTVKKFGIRVGTSEGTIRKIG